jgi:glucosamine--fructose-6-phosphate aminotransferase (isomerizing)
MNPFKPEVMIKQVEDTGNLIRTQFTEIDHRLRSEISPQLMKNLNRVIVTGDGDSWHASMAVKLAFQKNSGLSYESISAMRFLAYKADNFSMPFPKSSLVIGVSASGGSTRVIDSLEKIKSVYPEINTMALVGNPDSKLAGVADYVYSVNIPDFGPSPGIRTYVASLMGLYALALRIGEAKQKISADELQTQFDLIASTADVADRTISLPKEKYLEPVEALKGNTFFSYVGSGPSFASAYFSSAKLVEVAGVFSTAQDLEEWVHIEHHAYPINYPIYMVAPDGASYDRAEKLAYLVTLLGHPLIGVVQEGEEKIMKNADYIFPISGYVADEYSPLVYHIPANYFACYMAEALDRMPFMQDNEDVRNNINAFSSQIRSSDD